DHVGRRRCCCFSARARSRNETHAPLPTGHKAGTCTRQTPVDEEREPAITLRPEGEPTICHRRLRAGTRPCQVSRRHIRSAPSAFLAPWRSDVILGLTYVTV